jgi:tRNA(Ile)-lysidine synthase
VVTENLLKRVKLAVGKSLPDGGSLVVAVSGGADSVCLLHTLIQLQEELNLKLHIAHLNHCLRGAESDADAQYVADLSGKLSLPCTVEKRDIIAYGNTSSVEDKARHARYTFLSQVAKSVGASAVAVAHTADDQVETMLMHLVRGSGLAGLRGMKQADVWKPSADEPETNIIRPLLGVGRNEVEDYCCDNSLEPRVDSSNQSPKYLRNRFRHELTPLLKEYNANFGDSLLRLSSVVTDQIELLDGQVAQVWDEVVTQENHIIYIDRDAFGGLPAAVKRHLVRCVLERLAGTLADIQSIHIEDMLNMMSKPVGKRLSLPYELVMVNGYESSIVRPEDSITAQDEVLDGEYRLNVPGQTDIPGWKINASVINKNVKTDSKYVEYFDYDVIGQKLMVRGRRQSDKFRPLGMQGSKSLKDFMVDVKVSKAKRDAIPIVCSPEHIIWVVGSRIDERAKVSASTKRVLKVEFERVHIDSAHSNSLD